MMLSRKVCGIVLSVLGLGFVIWIGSVGLLDHIMQSGDAEESVPEAARRLDKLAQPLAIWRAEVLASSSASEDRCRAARALQFIRTPDRHRILFELVNDPDADTRAFALRSMTAMTDESVDVLLKRYAKAEPEELIPIVRTLGLLGNHRAFELLSSLATDEQYPLLQEEAIGVLARMGPEAIPVLTAGLDSRCAEVRVCSASALGGHGAPALPALEKALLKGDRRVRNMAANSLIKIGPPASHVLLAAMESEDLPVRQKAAQALIGVRDPRTFDALCVAALEAEDREVRDCAREALRGMPEVLANRLGKMFDDTDATIVRRAAKLTARTASVGNIPRLHQLLQHDNPEVRAECAWALGKLNSRESISHLALLLKDVAPEVKGEAAKALGRVKSKHAAEQLIGALAEASGLLTKEIESALAQSSRTSVGPLIQALSTDDVELQRRIVRILGRIKNASAIPHLEALLPNADEETSACIDEAVKRLEDD